MPLLAVSEFGYGKRTDLREYRTAHRAGKGIITFKANERTGRLISIMEVVDDDDLMLITDSAVILRVHVGNISTIGRNTMGVRIMRIDKGARVSDVARVQLDEAEDGDAPEQA